jgi:hypothetical protein
MSRILAAVAAVGLLALTAAPALAVGTLDQSQTNGSVTSLTWSLPPVAGTRMDLRQTFTVGKTGTLDTISVFGDDFGAAVTLQLDSSGGILDKQTVNMTGSHWTQVTLATPPKVTSGEFLTLALTPSSTINWYGTCDNLYLKGQAYVFDPTARTVETIYQYGLSTGNALGYCTLDFAFQTDVTTPKVATPVPTAKPATPAPSVARPAATVSAAVSSAPTDTPAASPTAAVPSDAAGVMLAAAGETATSSPAEQPGAPSGSVSGGGGDATGLIVIAVVALAAAGGAAWWFIAARRKGSSGGAAS